MISFLSKQHFKLFLDFCEYHVSLISLISELEVGLSMAQMLKDFVAEKKYFSINTQVVGGPNHEITNIVVRWPGSAHDSCIFVTRSICAKFENMEMSAIFLETRLTLFYTCFSFKNSILSFQYFILNVCSFLYCYGISFDILFC